jgi:hypothetical protein
MRAAHQQDLGGLAGEESPEARVEPAHEHPPGARAAGSAVADMADLVDQDLAVERVDARRYIAFVGEDRDASAA